MIEIRLASENFSLEKDLAKQIKTLLEINDVKNAQICLINKDISEEEILEGFSESFPHAEGLEINSEELLELLREAKNKTGAKGACIGEAFGEIFSRLKTDKTANFLSKFGIETKLGPWKFKRGLEILNEIKSRGESLSFANKAEIVASLGGSYYAAIINSLIF